jgi:hypothetical protein
MDFGIGRFQNEKYTGSNRCWKCTALNLILLSAVMGFVTIVSLEVAALGWTIGIAVLAVRGYVVPYTPWIAPALVERFPDSISFDHPSEQSAEEKVDKSNESGAGGEDVLDSLLRSGVIYAEDGELFLTDSFRDRWLKHIQTLAHSDDVTGALEAAIPKSVTVTKMISSGDEVRYLVASESGKEEQTISRSAALSDAGAAETLRETAPEIDKEARLQAAMSLRMFLKACPECGNHLRRDVRSAGCCGGGPYKECLVCQECDVELFTFGPP